MNRSRCLKVTQICGPFKHRIVAGSLWQLCITQKHDVFPFLVLFEKKIYLDLVGLIWKEMCS